MESNHHHIVESLIEKAEVYSGLKAKLIVYKGIEKASDSLSTLLSAIIVVMVFIPFFALLNIGICLWLSHIINSLADSFFIMAGFYLLIGAFLALLRKKIIKPSLANLIVKHILK